MAAAKAGKSVSAASAQCPGQPCSFGLHHSATATSPCGQRLLPSCAARGNPLRAPRTEIRIRPRGFLMGFYSCALPTARLGSLIGIFQDARNSTDLFSGWVRLPISMGSAFGSLPEFSGSLGKRSGHSSTSLCLSWMGHVFHLTFKEDVRLSQLFFLRSPRKSPGKYAQEAQLGLI